METMWHRLQGSVNLTVLNSICSRTNQKIAGTAAKLWCEHSEVQVMQKISGSLATSLREQVFYNVH